LDVQLADVMGNLKMRIGRNTFTAVVIAATGFGLAYLGAQVYGSTSRSPATASAAGVDAPPAFTCRLPVSGPDGASFIAFPSRTQIIDGSANAHGAVVFAGAKGWLGAPVRLMSPDLAAVAVADPRSRVVTISDLQGRQLSQLPADVDEVIGWTRSGVVAWSMHRDEVWIIDPKDGTHIAFAAHHLSFQIATGSGFWSLTGGVWRMDPATGAVTRWYSFTTGSTGRSGGSLLGFDVHGAPVVWDAPDGASGSWKVVLLAAPGSSTVIATSSTNSAFVPEHALGDAHGIWFTSTAGSVWLATSGRLNEIGGSNAYVIAGSCN
jgi:hypothetical protein